MLDSTTLSFDPDHLAERIKRRHTPLPDPGTVFTRLTFTGKIGIRDFVAPPSERRVTYYLECVCECDKVDFYLLPHLKRGSTVSCGCYGRENTSARPRALKYRQSTAKPYPLKDVWEGMKDRCDMPSHVAYKYYGAKGVTVCKEWRDFAVFEAWANDNGYAKGLSIDRIDFNGNYEPSNCRWADSYTQSRNKSRNVWIEMHGERKVLQDWLDDPRTACTDSATYGHRVKKNGLTPEQALMAERQSGGCKKKPFTFRPWPTD